MISKEIFDKRGVEATQDDDMKYISQSEKQDLLLSKINHYKRLKTEYGFVGFHIGNKNIKMKDTEIRHKTLYWGNVSKVIGDSEGVTKQEQRKIVTISNLSDSEYKEFFVKEYTPTIRTLLSKGQAWTKEEIVKELNLKLLTKIQESGLIEILKGVTKKTYDNGTIHDTYYFIRC